MTALDMSELVVPEDEKVSVEKDPPFTSESNWLDMKQLKLLIENLKKKIVMIIIFHLCQILVVGVVKQEH